MKDRLVEEIQNYVELQTIKVSEDDKTQLLQRLTEGNLTRDENPINHICSYFVAIDKDNGKIFIGLHKKSGLWLPNGGHIDKGETAVEAVEREMSEEWGENSGVTYTSYKPELITVTNIENQKQSCKVHFDIWFFINIQESLFTPEQSKLDTEFSETMWVNFMEARKLITNKSVLTAINYLSK